jgi:hypothetical protein
VNLLSVSEHQPLLVGSAVQQAATCLRGFEIGFVVCEIPATANLPVVRHTPSLFAVSLHFCRY